MCVKIETERRGKLTSVAPVANPHENCLVELLPFRSWPLGCDDFSRKAESGQLAKRPKSRSVSMKRDPQQWTGSPRSLPLQAPFP